MVLNKYPSPLSLPFCIPFFGQLLWTNKYPPTLPHAMKIWGKVKQVTKSWCPNDPLHWFHPLFPCYCDLEGLMHQMVSFQYGEWTTDLPHVI